MLKKSKISFAVTTLSLLVASQLSYGFETVSLGNAQANQAAGALSPATTIYNPAGLIFFDHSEISASVLGISDQTSFNGSAVNTNPTITQQPYVQSGSASARASGMLPSFFATYPINDKIYTGLAVYSPLSGSFSYPDDSIVRYEKTQAKLTGIDISPAFAIKLNSKWAWGLGLDANRFNYSETSQQINPEVLDPGPSNDLTLNNSARSWAYGWHTGILYQPSNVTRFGFSYTSKIVEHPKGSSKLSYFDTPIGESDNFNFNFVIPAFYRLGAFHQFNNRWSGMAQIHYTTWADEGVITANNVSDGSGDVVTTKQSFPGFRNTWGAAVSANYKVNEQWLLRGGVDIDQSPTRDPNHQQLETPNSTAKIVGVGAHYQITKMVGLDAGYSHIFMKPAAIDNYNPSTDIYLTGTLHSNVNIAGLELTWKFA